MEQQQGLLPQQQAQAALVRNNKTDLFSLEPADQMKYGAQLAAALKDFIQKQDLSVNIQGKEYVKVEGWTTLGTMLGILPRETSVKILESGGYEASVDLIRQKDGTIVGGASAICDTDEKRWGSADRYARRSMAVTRAVSKAYRLAFSWILTLAGYEATPFEEIQDVKTIYNASKPTQEIFDMHNRAHQDRLLQLLEVKFPNADPQTVADKLQGKPMTQSNVEACL